MVAKPGLENAFPVYFQVYDQVLLVGIGTVKLGINLGSLYLSITCD